MPAASQAGFVLISCCKLDVLRCGRFGWTNTTPQTEDADIQWTMQQTRKTNHCFATSDISVLAALLAVVGGKSECHTGRLQSLTMQGMATGGGPSCPLHSSSSQ